MWVVNPRYVGQVGNAGVGKVGSVARKIGNIFFKIGWKFGFSVELDWGIRVGITGSFQDEMHEQQQQVITRSWRTSDYEKSEDK